MCTRCFLLYSHFSFTKFTAPDVSCQWVVCSRPKILKSLLYVEFKQFKLSLPYLLLYYSLLYLSLLILFSLLKLFTCPFYKPLLLFLFIHTPNRLFFSLPHAYNSTISSLRSGSWEHIWPSRTWTWRQNAKQPCRSTTCGASRAGVFRL